MAKIIKLDEAQQRLEREKTPPAGGCDHKYVTVYRLQRTVRCSLCSALLDPFDVLVEMIQGYVPAMPADREEESSRLAREERRRKEESGKDDGQEPE